MSTPVATRATEIVLPGAVEPSGLEVRTRDLPAPDTGQVLLRMDATGVCFAEQQMRRGKYYNQPPFPFVPGYDVVGTVTATGPGVDAGLTGRRFAAVTKVGAWASHLLIDAAELMPVPDGIDAATAETVLVNGITAWQMLHRTAKVRAGGTVVVLGANGGVGSILVQLARHAGITVIGTASARHHASVRELGAIPVDYRAPDMYDQIRKIAPDGVDAVFDHVGGPGVVESWRLLRRGGTLVSYGTAATKDEEGSSQLPVLKLFGQLAAWNSLPNGRSAHFYNFWAGRRCRTEWRRRLTEDLTEVLRLVADGVLTPRIAAEIPLSDAASALALAESRTVIGKVVLVPGA
ncbi:medium chain dehydrogenase/reductase family protein [Streptomyces rapamycinicus]|uniref:NADPH:quinone reductase n=2 Tax=Streptomyces rapamycinicus TaxID=1226757 RepID=A0A0A0NMU9_STRRN|nr:medium chain dehydrogenase/reductase family protein [Streptomyces rapamycinicus]AGP57408.1 NADPH:quinone reductase [Streptomyces rapamycinicus NRRL 5491]MBB4785061.1 NADPH:quinone reductase-like Zn-dependent oxidoreductase [Streptomyces rapamycinicus]RLV79463.1 NADPH:quinone reductase [Streptomyces rapamycinicus NRRL 5491]UTO65289.1 medium chain dehydrogenase/reductase family protein [Streptomyces rapamycinicus]UTP33245.1 medium chain dehydrogenase/reductase family protein [Streptomyces rap